MPMMDREEKLITDEIRKLVPVLGKENAQRLSRAYLLGDEEIRKRIFELVDATKAAVFTSDELHEAVLMEPPPKDIATSGEIEVGEVIYGRKRAYPFRMPIESMLTHIGIFGSSGYGKTNISYCLIEKLSDKGIPVIVFDFSKRNYKDLLATKLKDRIDIYTLGRSPSPFKFNPLRPPEEVSLSQWIKEFSAVFDHAYWMMGGGRHIILKALEAIYEQKDNPVLHDIKRWLDEYGEARLPARERNWLATATRPLDSLCFREIGKIFRCREGVKPSEFFKSGRVTVLELDALDTNDKTFFIEIVLQWVRDWMLVSGSREKLKGVVILEEAHHVLNREKSSKLGAETLIELIFREIRELGLGMIYIDQHPSMVSYPALGNTSTHIYMNLGLDTKHASDILDASNMLGLDYKEEGSYLRKLPVGEGFVLNRMSGFPRPFTVRFDEFPIPKGQVTDEDISKWMEGKLPVEIEEEGIEHKDISKPETIKEEMPDPDELEDIDAKGWEIFKAVGDGKGSFTSQIYSSLKMSGSVFSGKVRHLMDANLVGCMKAKIGRNRMYYYFLTDKGRTYYTSKHGLLKGAGKMPIDDIVDMFSAVGWTCTRKDDTLRVETEKGETLNIMLVDSLDRSKVYSQIGKNTHFIASTKAVKNILLQEIARYSQRNSIHKVAFIALAEKFDTKADFERVEFGYSG